MVSLDERSCQPAYRDSLSAASDEVREVAKSGTPSDRSATLARIIEADIIPRLMLAAAPRGADQRSGVRLDIDAQDIDGFAALMIALDVTKANLVISTALARGVTVETLLLDLLAPTAQRLGVMWAEDLCTFTDVTVGLCGLQNLLRVLVSGDQVDPAALHDGRALLAALPGEQHTFGVLVLETFYRRAGWDVVGMPLATVDEILTAVSRRSFTIAGLSLARKSSAPAMRDLIAAVRKRSCNPAIVIMAGGAAFNDEPGLLRVVNADMTARDGRQAVIASQHVMCSTVQTH